MPNYSYKIIRSRRRKKTTAIRIRREGTVEIMVPHTMSDRDAKELLQKRKGWIARKLKELENRPQRIKKTFTNGELFSFLGNEYPLVIRTDGSRGEGYLSFNEQQFTATIPPNWKESKRKKELEKLFTRWYKKEGAAAVKREIDPLTHKLGVEYKEIKLKEVKSYWGTCTAKKRLNFNWKITLAPFPVFRYVAVHEVCHLKVPGHGKKFWDLVESFDPHCKKHRKWLKENSWQLSI